MMKRLVAIGGVMLLLPFGAYAEPLSFSAKNNNKTTVVTAEQTLEWQQDDKLYIARGNAKVVQEDSEITADEIIAHYRDKPKKTEATKVADSGEDNNSEIYRVDAVGHVTIKNKDDTVTGPAAVYDLDRKVLVAQGDLVTLTAKDGTVTAHKNIQYWDNDNVAVAEGDAVAVDTTEKGAGRKIKADKLTAFFRDKPDADNTKSKKKDTGSSKRDRDLIFLRGQGNAVLTTKTDVVRGDHTDYNLDTGIATVEGNVKWTRDNNQLNGGYAVVTNLKDNNASHVVVYNSAAQAKGQQSASPPARVKALLAPKNADDVPKPMGSR